MNEQEQKEIQEKAYLNREAIQPRDMVAMKCTDTDDGYCYFEMESGFELCCTQPKENGAKVQEDEWVQMYCTKMVVSANGFGRFVDYEFYPFKLGHTIIINGPDAQALKVVSKYAWS